MQRYPPKPMTPFDEIVTNQKLQFMKILLPFFPINFIKTFAFYIKFIELQNTLLHFPHIINQLSSITQIQSSDILEEIRPYMNSQDINSIESILSMLDMIKMMNTMDTDIMSDLSNFTDMPDILNMMNMFQHTENDNNMNSKKGNEGNDSE